MKEKQTMGIAAFVAIMTVISAVAVVGVVSYSDDVAADAEAKEYNIYIDLGGEVSSFILYDDPLVDYGTPEWVKVTATNPKDALTAACEQKFGEGSLTLTSSGYISEINGIDGNGLVFYPDQASTGEAEQYGINYYPIQFIMEDNKWASAETPIAAYEGESTTFAVVCQPMSFDEVPVEYTFDGDTAFAMNDDVFETEGLEERYAIFTDTYGWKYGMPSAPFPYKNYEIYIDLGGTVSAAFLGTGDDYGKASWETVTATNAKDALTAACEQKFGEGSIEYSESSYGFSVKTINGISGNGISFKSEQAGNWDDVYYYPVQYIMEDGVWQQASVTIPNYMGNATTFAIVIEPLTFDEIEHTFADADVQNSYDALMDTYAWPGYGVFPEPFISFDGIELSKEVWKMPLDFSLAVTFDPDEGTNTNVEWSTSDESVAVVDSMGNVHIVSDGTATITATTAYGHYQASCLIELVSKEYNVYIDLGGTVAGFFMGDDIDYGDASWETVTAYNAMDALTAACEQKFGAGSITYNMSSWGISVDTINGMSGNGISFKSEQAESWDDVYYYPVQYIMEDGVWQQASVTIPNYMGESTTLAIVTEPLTFDAVPVEHTFEKEDDKFVYEQFMEVYAWPGWGTFPEPFIAPAEIEVADVTIVVGGEYTPEVLITPENAFNKNVIWYTDDKDIVELGDFHPIITGLAEGVAIVTAYSTYDSLNVFCSFTVTVVENTMAEGDVFVQDGIKYTITSLEPLSAKVTGYEGSVVDVFIGKYVDYMGLTFEVESVGLKAFVGSDVKTATVMVDVGGFAFAKTPLKVLKLEGEIDVGRSAFTACYKLINVYVSDEVKSIGVNAFAGCTFVDENGDPIDATLDNLAGHKFTGNYKALKMYVPALYSKFTVDGIIYKVSSVEDKQVVVKGVVTGVTDLEIVPEVEYLGYTWTVTKVSNKAFYDNDTIRDVYVQGVNIGMKSFAKCDNLRIVSLEDVTTVGKYAFASSCIEALWCDAIVLSNSAFSAAKLMEVGFGSGLESIGTNAFYGNQFYDFDKNLIDIAPENLAGNSFEGSDGDLYQIVTEK